MRKTEEGLRERERVLACSAFENFYNLQFSRNLQEHIFQQKNSRSLISTTLQPTLPFFFFFSFFLFVLCFCLSDCPGHHSSSFSFCSDTLLLREKVRRQRETVWAVQCSVLLCLERSIFNFCFTCVLRYDLV